MIPKITNQAAAESRLLNFEQGPQVWNDRWQISKQQATLPPADPNLHQQHSSEPRGPPTLRPNPGEGGSARSREREREGQRQRQRTLRLISWTVLSASSTSGT